MELSGISASCVAQEPKGLRFRSTSGTHCENQGANPRTGGLQLKIWRERASETRKRTPSRELALSVQALPYIHSTNSICLTTLSNNDRLFWCGHDEERDAIIAQFLYDILMATLRVRRVVRTLGELRPFLSTVLIAKEADAIVEY